MKKIIQSRSIFFITMALFCALLTGCAALQTQSDDTGNAADTTTNPITSMMGGSQPGPLYYDFKDVLLPGELSLDKKDSFVYMTSGFVAGFLHLTGRVDGKSLVTFFENNMLKDNWQPVSSFRSARTLLLFTKKNRNCVIIITEKSFNTDVEVWVAPMEGAGGGNLMR